MTPPQSIYARLPFYYGWVVVCIAFITMGIGVNARNAYSLLFPPIVDEFGWSRSDTVGSFAIGFVASSFLAPFLGVAIDRFGPRWVFPAGGIIVSAGLVLMTYATDSWHFQATLGIMVVGGSVIFAYVGHSAFLPHWFHRRRALAIGIAFSGVGIFGFFMLPWLQSVIDSEGWRAACWTLAVTVLLVVVPLNLFFQKRRPDDIGLRMDGGAPNKADETHTDNTIVDADWVKTEWTLLRAMATARFWWLAAAFFCALYSFYAIQVHQTKFLQEVGFSTEIAAYALGLVVFLSVPGLIIFGYLSDRFGREWIWTLGCAGFVICCVLLLLLNEGPDSILLYAMIFSQGFIGVALSPNYAAIPAELFQGRHYGAIFGTLSLATTAGGGAGPWFSGYLYDIYQSYTPAFIVALAASVVSMLCVWMAAPRKVRKVGGHKKITEHRE